MRPLADFLFSIQPEIIATDIKELPDRLNFETTSPNWHIARIRVRTVHCVHDTLKSLAQIACTIEAMTGEITWRLVPTRPLLLVC